ncbi:hypothetical protein TIFTF001_000326 [Ficus carica]|uniref:Mitochondrial 28S ribosomal protein S34 n=1 Tax=Ficus carica TaxID=3494 RepID=A0AA87Z1R3_FICCA|nr:hypothetical protein TIFTF001_000326 [Ficus carica]
MASSLANRASANRSLSVLKLSLNFLRGFSTASYSSPSPSSSSSSSQNPSASSSKKKPKRKKKKNLFEVAQFLPNWGIGYHMAKTHWTGVSYEITKINLYKDGRHGKAWGIVHKDDSQNSTVRCWKTVCVSLVVPSLTAECILIMGLQAADAPKKISGVHKRCWRYIPNLTKSIGSETSATKPTENASKADAQAA